MDLDYEKKYHEIETYHFWFKARRNYILQLLEGEDKNKTILDIGCSSGILLNDIQKIGFKNENLYGIDISEKAIENCKLNGIQNAFVMDAQDITLDKKFDLLVASDNLEHLENEQQALENWYNLLAPGGKLLVFVPALMSLWSHHDVVNMHFRRYTKTQLEDALKNQDFKIQKSSYWNFLLFFPVFAVRTFSRLLPKPKNQEGDLNKIGAFNSFLLKMMNIENKLLNSINFPIGVSCYCVAEKV